MSDLQCIADQCKIGQYLEQAQIFYLDGYWVVEVEELE